PKIYNSCVEAHRNGIDIESMNKVPEESVDYAVFEKSDRIKTVQSSFKWDDLGNFDSLFNYFINDTQGESSIVKNVEGINVQNCSSLSGKKVLGIGLSDLNIIESEGMILILRKGEGQGV